MSQGRSSLYNAMSILYDPHTKRPQVWTVFLFFILTITMAVGIYLYGNRKAGSMPPEAPGNSLFEDAEG